jgi:SAM-dependent methyltransferase
METGPEKPPDDEVGPTGTTMTEPVDKEGHETLTVISEADNFNRWMFDVVGPWVGGRVLETGSGIGNISSLLLGNFPEVWLSDISESYLRILGNRFSPSNKRPRLSTGTLTAGPVPCGILRLDVVDPAFDERFGHLFGSFDTVVALNVIEHVADDALAVGNCRKLLKNGGRFIMLVPAYQALYNRFDQELGHCRRYTEKGLRKLLGSCLSVEYTQYFNLAGIAGWFFSGTILRKKIIPSSQMRIFNWFVPLFRVMDRMVFYRIGLSVLAVAKKE